jgi:hypothetical protein
VLREHEMMVVNIGGLYKIKEVRHLVLMGGLVVINEEICISKGHSYFSFKV